MEFVHRFLFAASKMFWNVTTRHAVFMFYFVPLLVAFQSWNSSIALLAVSKMF